VDAVAFGASRVMGTCMAVGQAAGTAAALCVRDSVKPRELSGKRLRQMLIDQEAF
jgi:hypothetical protein